MKTNDADKNDIGIDADVAVPFMPQCELERFKSKMNSYLKEGFNFTIGEMRDRTMPANLGKGVIEYVAKCCCAGKYREGWVFFYILICKTETIFNCFRNKSIEISSNYGHF